MIDNREVVHQTAPERPKLAAAERPAMAIERIEKPV